MTLKVAVTCETFVDVKSIIESAGRHRGFNPREVSNRAKITSRR